MNYPVKKVMIIDDNEIDNFVTRRVMQNSQFAKEVMVMTSGRGALEFFEDHKEKPEELPDLIFLDLNMPIVDGFVFLFQYDEFPEEVRNRCKIIVLSSILEKKVIDKILSNEYVNDFVPKPLTESSLKRINVELLSAT
jgi:CheY-like chemotaxis protein